MSDTRNGLFSFVITENFNLEFSASPIILAVSAITITVYIALRLIGLDRYGRSLEIEEAEIGLGNQKITLKPNDTDRQIAYQIWVELNTRKIGLPIDLADDVITEIYDSWYSFFGITRDLVKNVPVSKFRRRDTENLVRLSMEVLNIGIRPHLTKWQARYRRWYEHETKTDENLSKAPQEIQRGFPSFDALQNDIVTVNHALINYRDQMYKIVSARK